MAGTAAAGAAKGAFTACAVLATGAPHFVQNFRPLVTSAPQAEHFRSSFRGLAASGEPTGLPQAVQNFMLGAFSTPHFTQKGILTPRFTCR
jgi:hypothetical protein